MKKSNKPIKKIQHDYTCDVCGKPATFNQQDWNKLYSISREGDFQEIDDWEGSYNEFYCDKHLPS